LKTFAVTATAIGKIPRGLFNRLYPCPIFLSRPNVFVYDAIQTEFLEKTGDEQSASHWRKCFVGDWEIWEVSA
jgi:hypothetical protein